MLWSKRQRKWYAKSDNLYAHRFVRQSGYRSFHFCHARGLERRDNRNHVIHAHLQGRNERCTDCSRHRKRQFIGILDWMHDYREWKCLQRDIECECQCHGHV